MLHKHHVGHTNLRIPVDRVRMRIGLITARHTVALDVAHHAVAGRYHRWGQRLLQLLLLLAVLGASILEPYL